MPKEQENERERATFEGPELAPLSTVSSHFLEREQAHEYS